MFTRPNSIFRKSRLQTVGPAGTKAPQKTRAWLEPLEVRTMFSAPAAPSSLHAIVVSSTQVNLTWMDNSSNETGFEVDYSTSSNFSSGVSTLLAGTDTGSKWVTGLSAGNTYYFRVRATNGDGDSSNSSSVTGATPTAGTTRMRLAAAMS